MHMSNTELYNLMVKVETGASVLNQPAQQTNQPSNGDSKSPEKAKKQ